MSTPGEFGLIERHFSPPTTHTLLAGGDDAALLEPAPGRQLAVTTDMLVEGVHFLPGTDAEALGHKTLAVNLSDLAAMGAEPRWAFLALALPEADEAWCAAFMAGFQALARRHGTDLAGGDTTRGPRNLCVTLVGEVTPGRALRRDAARPGDDLWLSGCTGEAAAGLWLRLGRVPAGAAGAAERVRCEARLDRPEPRVALGRAVSGLAHAAIDVSDGLLADLGHVCRASGTGAELWWSRLPHSSALSWLSPRARAEAVLSGGDDYELILTAPPEARHHMTAAAIASGTPLARIGRVSAEPGVRVLDRVGRDLTPDRRGFDHFG